ARERRGAPPGLGRDAETGGGPVPGVAPVSEPDAAGGPAAVRLAPAALHGAREARLPEAAERGASGAARPLPADARRGLHVHARFLVDLLRGHGVAPLPGAG